MLSDDQLLTATLADLREWFLAGHTTPSDYLNFCFKQIDRINPGINAVLKVYHNTAEPAAEAATKRYTEGRPRSEIDGMPIGVKANISVRGYVCHGGIKAYEDNIPAHDADIVHRLRRAGAVIIGSLNMEEGALGAQTDNPWYGKSYNPLKPGYTPGGSSGGSAAAVAAGMMPASLGTDTMGSVRIPSSYCGLVGFKPSPGTYSTQGVMPLSTTLDTVGTHTRTVKDAVMIYKAVTQFDGHIEARAPKDISPFDMTDSDVDPEILTAFEHCLDALPIPKNPVVLTDYDYGQQRRAGLILSEAEATEFHTAKDFQNSDGFSDHFKSMLAYGQRQPVSKVQLARDRIAAAGDVAAAYFNEASALMSPTAPQTAFKFGDAVPVNQADFTAFANFAKLPAVSLPMGMDSESLPMGLQIMTQSTCDHDVLEMALFIEDELKQ